MSTQDTPRCTRPSNATARPGQIVLDAKNKRRTKAQKAADDLALKEAQEAQVQKGLERLAGMQNEMEKVQEELLNKKAIPIRPKPRARKATKPVVRSGDDHTDNMMEADEANDLQEAVEIMEAVKTVEAVKTMEAAENMEDGTTGAKKRKVTKKGGKALIKDAISNMQKKINEPSSKLEGDNANNVARVASIFDDNVDFDEPNAPVAEWGSQGPQAPFTQIENRGTLKRKASVDDVFNDDKESMVSDWFMDIEGPDFEDTFEPKPEPPVVVKKEKDPCTTFSTSVLVVTSVPDRKPPAPKKIKVGASTARARSTPAIKHQLNVDTGPENMKPRSIYYQCWAKKYLPTVMLWAGSYEDLWTIPDDVLLLHAQLIFNAVYKELNITIVHGDVIYSLTAQRISEWRSNFSSMGLLLGIAHLNAISGYVDVPDLDTHALAIRAIRMSGVITLCAAAIDARGKLVIKLPKVLNKVTGRMTNAPFLFSAARWAKVTTSFIKSISSKPAGYIETTVQMARACTALNDAIESPQDSLNDDKSEDNECTMLFSSN
ncbi:uncharacterized protein EDB91DRAFT_1087554 [Suillus paluster]|uniref:uncharacterized protein n=1 Tax=Suillus paluster TaxID=48578 RepID=UPI001B87F6CB|nr:uncharacterized protein EDB91DRAFT_1087554 [Suillus paluster]KAG1724211.1 hypothetical protein EDB91DRAFT_1087554 [Suillus paluster]